MEKLGASMTKDSEVDHYVKQKCKICHSSAKNPVFLSREKYHGTFETFNYMECSHCKTLTLLNVPTDLSVYYDNYYSFNQKIEVELGFSVKRMIRCMRTQYFISNSILRSPIGWFMSKFSQPPQVLHDLGGYIFKLKVPTTARILDVGCGNGIFIKGLFHEGYQNLLGSDPFLDENEVIKSKQFKLLKADIFDLKGTFDFIILNHVFEHVPDPRKVLNKAKSLLADKGVLVIRMPVSDSYAWKKYKGNWSGLHTPRHLNIFSEQSMKLLVDEADLLLEMIEYDSDPYQFWISEQNKNNIPFIDAKSYFYGIENSIFTAEEISGYARETQKLNETNQGDAASYIMYKI